MKTVDVETVGQELLTELAKGTGAEGVGYILWGVSPKELITSLEELAKEVPALVPYLRAHKAWIRREGFTLMALLVDGKAVYAAGTKVPIQVLSQVKA
jgi:orotidine-5'-phosphate decarboxylase